MVAAADKTQLFPRFSQTFLRHCKVKCKMFWPNFFLCFRPLEGVYKPPKPVWH